MSDPRFNNFKIGGYMYDCLFVMYVHRLLRQLTVERCCKLCFDLKEYTTASGGPTAPNQVMVDVLWISRKYFNYDASILHIYMLCLYFMFICIYFVYIYYDEGGVVKE